MSRLKQICPKSILMMIYNTLSLPHLNYGILLWGAKVKKDQKLHLFQKKSMRIITSQHYRSHSEPIFKNLGLLMVHDLYYMAIIKFYYNMMNGHLPDDFFLFFISIHNKGINIHMTYNNNDNKQSEIITLSLCL